LGIYTVESVFTVTVTKITLQKEGMTTVADF